MATRKTENLPWGPTRLALLGYGLATTVGFIYAKAYYSSFDIDILNYVTPIDLLFISLENIDKVLVVTSFVPIVLLWVAIGLPVLLFVALAVLTVLAVVAIVYSMILLAFSALISLGIGAAINAARLIIWRFKCLKRALYATSVEEPFHLAAAYRDARKSVGRLKTIEMDEHIKEAKEIINRIMLRVWNGSGKAWDRLRQEYAPRWRRIYFEQGSWFRFKPLTALTWGPRLVVLGLLVFLLCNVGWAAWRTGRVDALQMLSDDGENMPAQVVHWFSWFSESTAWQVASPFINYIGQAICPAVPMHECGEEGKFEKVKAVYVIPTGNIASLAFSDCVNERGSKGNVRASGRYDERRQETGCLTYLGATGSMQFFAGEEDDTKDSSEPAKPVVVVVTGPSGVVEEGAQMAAPSTGGRGSESGTTDGESEVAKTQVTTRTVVVVVDDPANSERDKGGRQPACDMKLAAWVGPFAVGRHDLGEEQDGLMCFEEGVARFNVAGSSDEGKLKDWWKKQGPNDIQRLVLVGRADREPINDEHYYSNFALAQARANWVREQLEVGRSGAPHVLSVPGGPASTFGACDRIVEIHVCSGPPKTDAEDGGAQNQSGNEAGRGVEERL